MNIIHDEVWKDIPDYEGYYQCSNMGRVRSLDRHYYNSRGRKRYHAGVIIRQNTDPQRYKQVGLHKNGVSKTFRVHVLVMLCFVGERQGDDVINHKDGDKDNNSVENLEYCSQSHNMYHAHSTGLIKIIGKKGEANNSSKLLDWQVSEVRTLHSQGATQISLALKFNVSKSLISSIVRGESWRHLL